jgi:hypothetical protein
MSPVALLFAVPFANDALGLTLNSFWALSGDMIPSSPATIQRHHTDSPEVAQAQAQIKRRRLGDHNRVKATPYGFARRTAPQQSLRMRP